MTFTRLHTVAIPVTDQERSKALFESLGFTATFDQELQPGFRWIEMSFPGQTGTGANLSLVEAGDGLPTGIDTGIRLITDDARAEHNQVAGTGCSVGELLDWETAPLMFSFTDPDGNRFYVTQDE